MWDGMALSKLRARYQIGDYNVSIIQDNLGYSVYVGGGGIGVKPDLDTAIDHACKYVNGRIQYDIEELRRNLSELLQIPHLDWFNVEAFKLSHAEMLKQERERDKEYSRWHYGAKRPGSYTDQLLLKE